MGDKDGRFGPVFVGSGHIDKNLPLFAHGFFVGLQRLVVAAKYFTLGEGHGELEGLAFGIPFIGEIGIDLIIGAHGEFTVSVFARIFGVAFRRAYRKGGPEEETQEKTAGHSQEGACIEHRTNGSDGAEFNGLPGAKLEESIRQTSPIK